jgi:hypothetical protein
MLNVAEATSWFNANTPVVAPSVIPVGAVDVNDQVMF